MGMKSLHMDDIEVLKGRKREENFIITFSLNIQTLFMFTNEFLVDESTFGTLRKIFQILCINNWEVRVYMLIKEKK